MLNCCVSYINLIRVESIFAIFYAVFPQAVLETPMPMRVLHTHALVKVPKWELGAPRPTFPVRLSGLAFAVLVSVEECYLPIALRHLQLRVSISG